MGLTEVKFLYFTQTGKTATPADCDKLCFLFFFGLFVFSFDTKSKGNKIKNKQVGLHQTKNLHSKRISKVKKRTYGVRRYLQTVYRIRG